MTAGELASTCVNQTSGPLVGSFRFTVEMSPEGGVEH